MGRDSGGKTAGKAGGARELEALGEVYNAHSRAVYAYVRFLGASSELAEDVLHEVFVRMVRQGVDLERVVNMRAFLFTAARREFFRWRTRILRRKECGAEYLRGILDEKEGQGGKVDVEAVEKALAGLPVLQREVVVMKVYGGLSFEEIAAVADTSINTAASRYRYALAKLRGVLGAGEQT